MRSILGFGTTLAVAASLFLPLSSSAENLTVSETALKQCLTYDTVAMRNACYDIQCRFSTFCARLLITAATELGGPGSGMLVLHDLYDRNMRTVTKDGHDLAHQIGRTAATMSAGDWLMFLSCPDDFFLGCKHGFFESMLGELGSSVDAASRVCENAPPTERMFCFHGMGHGIFMANANDVTSSLSVCDALPDTQARQGCYQGVFMENVNAASRGETRQGTLDPDDVLAPCNRIEPKYRTQCYGQHADYVLRTLSGSLLSAVEACERAGKAVWVRACISHLGQNMTTFDYQTKYLGAFDLSRAPEGAVTLCSRFPARHQEDCRRGAAHNFMLYDQPEQATMFCNLTGDDACPAVVIPYLNRPIYSPEDRVRICAEFSQKRIRDECLHPIRSLLMRQLVPVLIVSLLLCGVIALLALSRSRRVAASRRG